MDDDIEFNLRLPAANPSDSGLGVYALSQFAYCPRAGVITSEKADPNAENPPAMRRLDFQPRWSLIEIERRLSYLLRTGWYLLVAVVGVSVLTSVLLFFWPVPAVIFGLAAMAALAWKLVRIAAELFALSMLRSEVLNALPIEPVFPFSEPEPINWWQLFQAGFISREFVEKLTDDHSRLAGKPWRVLERGSIRIPVCRVRSESRIIRRSHIVRMAAYCQLIENCTGQESPYGVILWAGTFEGIAIPNSSGNQSLVAQEVLRARRILESVSASPPDPPAEHVCERCNLGFPKFYRRGKTDTVVAGKTLPVFQALGEDGRIYHSECGDRFCWTPPHERADEKHLT